MAKKIEVVLELDNSKFNRNLKTSETKVDQFSKKGTSSIKGLGAAFAALGGASVVKGIVETGAAFQDLQNSLNVVFGSVEAGADAFSRVQDFAASTQFSVQTLTQAFVQLKGAGVEPTEELLMTFADTASVTTDQMGTFQAALDLVSRSTAGGLGLEDLNRLADRGIPVFTILQEKLGITRLEVSEFGKTAAGADAIISALLDGLQEDFGGALESQLKNLNFQLNQLGDAFDNLKNALFQTFSDDATNAVSGLTDAINSLAKNTAAINAFVDTMKALGVVLLSFGALAMVNKGFSALFNIILGGTGTVGSFSKIMKNMGNNIRFATMPTKELAESTGKYVKRTRRLGKTVGTTTIIMQRFTSALGFVANGLKFLLRFAGIAGLIYGIASAIETVSAAVFGKGPFKYLSEQVSALAKKMEPLVFKLFPKLEGYLNRNKFELDLSLSNEGINPMAEITEQMEIQREQQKRIREKAARDAKKAMAEYDALTDNDTLFDMDPQVIDHLKMFSDEIDRSKGGIDEYNRLMKLFNGMFSDPETIAEMETRQQALDDLNNSYASLFDPITALNEAISDGVVDQAEYNALQAEILKLQEAGILSAEAAAEAQRNLDDAFGKNSGLQDFISTLNRATDTLADDLANAMMEGKNAMESFKSFFKTLVTQIIADALKLLVIIPILEAIGFSTTGGSITGLSGGGFLGKIGFKQTSIGGGNLMPNRPVLVGESGPELFYPSTSGSVLPNGMGTQVTYNINAVDAPSFQALVARDPEFIYAVTRQGARRLPGVAGAR